MEDILIFITLVFGVLNLILFFKIWGMTNQVKKLNSKIEDDKDYMKYLWLGDRQKAYEALCRTMYEELSKNDNWRCKVAVGKKAAPVYHSVLRDDIEKYKRRFERMGMKIPERFSSVENMLKFGTDYND